MGLKHWILHKDHFKTHFFFFFNFWVGATLFSLDLGPKGGSNFKALWRSHLTSVRGPISYRIRFMTSRSFFVFYFFSTWTLPLPGIAEITQDYFMDTLRKSRIVYNRLGFWQFYLTKIQFLTDMFLFNGRSSQTQGLPKWNNLDLSHVMACYYQNPDLGQGLEFDFTFAM